MLSTSHFDSANFYLRIELFEVLFLCRMYIAASPFEEFLLLTSCLQSMVKTLAVELNVER